MNFTDVIYLIDKYGVDDVLLPFILVFTVVYAALQKTKALGEKKNINLIISIVMGLGFVIPHVLGRYPDSKDPVIFINDFLPNISLVLVVLFSFLLVMHMFSFDVLKDTKKSFPFVVLFAVLVNSFFGEFYPILLPIALIITVLIMVYLIMYGKKTDVDMVPLWIFIVLIVILIILIFYVKGLGGDLPIWLQFIETRAFRNNLSLIAIVVALIMMAANTDEDKK